MRACSLATASGRPATSRASGSRACTSSPPTCCSWTPTSSQATEPEALATIRLILYKMLFHSKALLWKSIILLLPPPTCKAYRIAILLHDYCAIYVPPSTPRVYATNHTILGVAISRKGQEQARAGGRMWCGAQGGASSFGSGVCAFIREKTFAFAWCVGDAMVHGDRLLLAIAPESRSHPRETPTNLFV